MLTPRRVLSCSLLASLLLLTAAAPTTRPLPQGTGTFTFPNPAPASSTRPAEPLTVFYYKPPAYTDGPILVVFHGMNRNADEYRDYAKPLADRANALVIAPLFDRARFPNARYNRGGIVQDDKPQPPENWTYAAIPKLVDFVRDLESKPNHPYYCIGHSAGGQFLMRMAAFLPAGAVRIVAANPGTDLFPTRDQDFGYGFGTLPEELSNDTIIKAYLAAPLTLYLGTGDITPEHGFDGSPEGMRQGKSRLERGRNAFAFAQKLATEKGWPFNWKKVEVEGIDHDSQKMFPAPEALTALFGPDYRPPTTQPATK